MKELLVMLLLIGIHYIWTKILKLCDISDKETDNTNSTSKEEEEVNYNPNEIAENVYYNE